MKLIYPDTNLWSYLADLPVDEKTLVDQLASNDATLVLSAHAVYELARIFANEKAHDVARHFKAGTAIQYTPSVGFISRARGANSGALLGRRRSKLFVFNHNLNPR
jgi:hypothetical protein